ncbi:MAG: hypothetical protein KAG66_13365, partial [Methylococcales bacterium]|nr:hypothetical protein [Methylococcales bacterium]
MTTEHTPGSTRQPGLQPPRTRLGIYGGMAVLSAAVLWLTYQFVEPAPPDTLTIATGNAEGAYHAFAQQLALEFADEGATLTLRETAGSVENLKLLEEDNDVQIAFLQSGIARADK